MSVTILADNVLETATVTVSPSATNAARLYDRDQNLQWQPSSATQYIDADALSATLGAVALLNPTAAGAVTVYSGASSPAATTRATLNPAKAGGVYAATFAPVTARYWRVRATGILGVPFGAGEIMVSTPRTISMNPFVSSNGRQTVANVQRDASPGGYRWTARRGAARARFEWQWPWITAADLAAIEAAFTACGEGARNVVVIDQYGTARWMTWMDDLLKPEPLGLDAYALSLTFEEAL